MANTKRRCRYCKTRKPLSELQIINGGAYCIEGDHAVQYAIEQREKGRQKAEKVRRQESAERKREYKKNDLRHQKTLTRQACNKLVRLLDEGKPCISCGKPWDKTFQAGHFHSVGSHPELRFDLRNIHAQCPGDNLASERRKSTQRTVAQEYEARLIERYGDDLVSWLNGPHAQAHYTCEDLLELRKLFNSEIRRIERGEGPSRDWRALSNEADYE